MQALKTIYEVVRQMEQLDKEGRTQISEHVTFDMRDTLERIDAYLNSKHISGDVDSMGREKPFFNIVTAAVNVWYRATDIDRKNISVRATKSSDYALAFLATLFLQEWMKKAHFGAYLNDWGRTLCRYGSAVSKFVEKKGELHVEVVPWNRLIVDPVDFESNPVVEVIWLTPAQLKNRKDYDQELVQNLLDSTTIRRTNDGQNKDTKADYIKVYEVHGELPLSYLTDNDNDDETFVQQMHVISFQDKKDGGGFDEFTLFSGKEAKSPYVISHLIKEDGRSLARGAVEQLFEAQWMVNHNEKAIKDQLDLANKLLFQTSDQRFIGQNVLTNIENGDILLHSPNQPLTQINNRPDIAAMQSSMQQWQAVGLQINGINEAMITAPKSGTAWRQTQAVLAESHSLFELMTENKGLALEKMIREYVVPHLMKKMDTTEEIAAMLEEHQVKQLDSMFVPNEAKRRANEVIKKTILEGNIFDPAEQQGLVASQEDLLKQALAPFGNQRFVKPSEIKTKTWKNVMKDLEWRLDIDVTGENKDIQSVLTTLTNVLQTVAGNPQILQDPNAKMVFGRILNIAGGISPVELAMAQPQPQQQVAQPEISQFNQQ